jgi:hypothetical protein
MSTGETPEPTEEERDAPPERREEEEPSATRRTKIRSASSTRKNCVRHQSATANELSRIAELSGIPGETLMRLAGRMERRDLAPGEALEAEGRFGVVLAGMLRAEGGLLRPGDSFSGRVTAVTPATVASCERSTYEEMRART